MRGVLKYEEGREKPATNVEGWITANTIFEFRVPGSRKVVFIFHFLYTFKKNQKVNRLENH